MIIYVPASDAIKSDYLKLKQHLMKYTGKIVNFKEYDEDARYMCNNHQMDVEIKSVIIDTVGRNLRIGCHLMPQLGEHDIPLDKHLTQNYKFDMNKYGLMAWETWPYFTTEAVKYIYRNIEYNWQDYLLKNISKIQWTDECLAFILSNTNDMTTIKIFLDKSNLSLSTTTLIAAYRTQNDQLIKMHNMPITYECVYAAIDGHSPYATYEYVLKLINALPMTSDTLSLMIKSERCTEFNEILKHVVPDQSHVKLACMHRRIDLIERLLNYKLTVDAECFELMFFTNIKADPKNIADAIEIFISAGYELTYNDAVRLAYRGYYVHDINRFNYKIDNELIEACIFGGLNVYNEILCTVEALRLACLVKNNNVSSNYIEIILDNGVIPDRQCVINAVMTKQSMFLISRLIEYVKIDSALAFQLIKLGYPVNFY